MWEVRYVEEAQKVFISRRFLLGMMEISGEVLGRFLNLPLKLDDGDFWRLLMILGVWMFLGISMDFKDCLGVRIFIAHHLS